MGVVYRRLFCLWRDIMDTNSYTATASLRMQWRRRVLFMVILELCVMSAAWSIVEWLLWPGPAGTRGTGGTGVEIVRYWLAPGVVAIGSAILVSIWLDKKLRITELKHRIELSQPKGCPKCGYTLVPGKPDDPWTWFCPECGATFDTNGCDV